MKRFSKVVLLALILSLFAAFFYWDLQQYLNLYWMKEQQVAFAEYYHANPWQTLFMFAGVYITVTALSFPGAVFLTLLAGALFGFWEGVVMVSFASTIGATLAFLAARLLLHDWVQAKFSHRLVKINDGFRREGNFYLFSLRLVPLFPFFVVNLVMGLTPIRVLPYYIVSQVGMFPATIVFVLAGTELGQLESLAGILNLKLIVAFSLIGLLPIASKRLLLLLKLKGITPS